MLLFIALSLLSAPATSSPGSQVPWAEARVALGEPICAMVYALPDGTEGYSSLVGMRDDCKIPPASTPLQKAVDKAYERSQRLTMSMHPEALGAAYEPGLSPDERTRRAREAYLGSEEFLRAVGPRLRAAMVEEGLACSGCPEFPPRPMRRIAWSVIEPYLAAYVWPDPVRRPKAEAGKPPARPHYSLHVCVGLNGIDELKDPDPLLVRAGFLAVFGNTDFIERASSHFENALAEKEFIDLRDDNAQTRYLRDHVGPATVKDPAARAAACKSLAELSEDLALEVADCLEKQAEPKADKSR